VRGLVVKRIRLFSVVTNRLNRTSFKGLHAQLDIFLRGRLRVDEGIATLFVALEKRRRRLPAEITIDALLIDVKFASGIVFPFFCFVGHESRQSRGIQCPVKT